MAVMVMDVEFGDFSERFDDGKTSQPQPLQWPYRVMRKSRSDAANDAVASLEDEITALRRKMVDAFVQYNSLTAEQVMEISRLLDAKINEYMKAVLKGPG